MATSSQIIQKLTDKLLARVTALTPVDDMDDQINDTLTLINMIREGYQFSELDLENLPEKIRNDTSVLVDSKLAELDTFKNTLSASGNFYCILTNGLGASIPCNANYSVVGGIVSVSISLWSSIDSLFGSDEDIYFDGLPFAIARPSFFHNVHIRNGTSLLDGSNLLIRAINNKVYLHVVSNSTSNIPLYSSESVYLLKGKHISQNGSFSVICDINFTYRRA